MRCYGADKNVALQIKIWVPSNGEGHTFYSSDYVDNTLLRPILEVTVTDITEWASSVSGLWDEASNWDPSVVPDSTRNVLIQPDNGLVVTGPAAATTVGRMTIGAQVSGVTELRTQSSGVLTITNDLVIEVWGRVQVDGSLSAGLGIDNGGEIELVSGSQLSGGALANTGLLHGSGTVANVLDNQAGGEVRVMTGQTMTLTGTSNTNVGQINLLGGSVTLDQDLTNQSSGTINGRGTLTCTGGLTNQGDIQFSGGASDVHGDVTNTGKIIVSGSAAAAIHDALLHNAGEIRVSQDSHLTTHSTADILAGAEANVTGAWTTLGAVTSAGDVELISGGQISGAALANTGLIHGDGIIGNQLDNQIGGEVRVNSGYRVRLTASGSTNSGLLRNNGGALEFSQALVSDTDGTVSGQGLFEFHGGLTLQGAMNLESGASDMYGDLHLADAVNSVLNIASGAVATFYDNVDHDGSAIDVTASGQAIFFGDVTGAGSFTGDGDVFFEGTYSPGSSPAAVDFQGNVTFGADAILVIELGGLEPGDDYDLLNISGALLADGILDLILINGFTPELGNMFDILDWGSLAGSFDEINLPSLGPDLDWDTSSLYATGVLTVTGGVTPRNRGDSTGDGFVGADDLVRILTYWGASGPGVTWDMGDCAPYNDGINTGDEFIGADDYVEVLTYWGATYGGEPVPEPAILGLLLVGGLALLRRGR